MGQIKGLGQLEAIFKQCTNTSNMLLYDPVCNLAFIYGEKFKDLVLYLCGKISYTSLTTSTTGLIIHERQHYLDLCHTVYGMKEIQLFYRIIKRLARKVEQHAQGSMHKPDNLDYRDLMLFYESHLNRSKVERFGEQKRPTQALGYHAEVGQIWQLNPEVKFEKVEIEFVEPINQTKIAKITVAEKSIVELSALGAEYQWKKDVGFMSAKNEADKDTVFKQLEDELFMMVHDFHKPNYVAAFHAAHISLQQSASGFPGNFPLLRSVIFGGMIARLAIHVVGTSSAKLMKWNDEFLAYAGNADIARLLSGNLCAVFYNIILNARNITITPELTSQDWLNQVIYESELGSIQKILLSGSDEIARMHSNIKLSQEKADDFFLKRLLDGQKFLIEASHKISERNEPEWLMFFGQVHPINWIVPLTNIGQPVLVQGPSISDEEADARVVRGLTAWGTRAIIKRIVQEVESANI